jgi:Protein of unknown function (DUF1588)/Protein of unknown function (DUF1592)/Protein of unknown function (DUF1595)/Protein of unknown function (DUF1587)
VKLRDGVALGLLAMACSSNDERGYDARQAPARELLAPSLRRLSSAELERGAEAVLQVELDFSDVLPPDARQHDFSRSLTQSVDALSLTQLYDAVRAAAESLELTSVASLPCARTATADDATCSAAVIEQLSRRAFRRDATAEERAQLQALFDEAAQGSFRDGLVQVVRALLGSPQFWYESAFGEPAGSPSSRDSELASQLSWLVSGAPADDELIRAGAAGKLRSGAERERQARRLLSKPESRFLYRRFIEEWLGLVRLPGLSKASTVADDFPELRDAMLRETAQVVDDVLTRTGGSLEALLRGGFTLPPPELAPLYGIGPPEPGQRVSMTALGRIGILQHASFLSTFAHEHESAPVLRGKAVLERLLCRRQTPPSELGIELVLPAVDPTATTRERYASHAQRPECAACHDDLDGVGFTFESFDAVGRARTTEASKPIDTSGKLFIDGAEVPLADSAELADVLASSDELYECAARHWVRFAAGERADAVELDFVATTRSLPEEERRSLLGLMLAYVRSDWFAERRAP